MQKILSIGILKIIILTILLSLSHQNTFSQSENKNDDGKNEEQKLRARALFLEATKQKVLENWISAIDLYKACIKNDSQHDAAKFELANIYFAMKMYEDALGLINEAIEMQPENIWYQTLLADIYQAKSQYEKAAQVYKKLSEREPENLEYLFNWAIAELLSHNYKESLELFDKIESKIGISEEISLQKEKIYLRMNKVSKAIEEVNKLIEAFPEEIKYYGLLAELYESDNNRAKALEIFEELKTKDPNNPEISLTLAKYYLQQGDIERSTEETLLAINNPRLDIETKIKIIFGYYFADDYEKYKQQAFQLIDALIKNYPNEAKAYSVYADFLRREKRNKEAIEQFEKVVSLDSSRYSVWEQLLILYSEEFQYKKLAESSNTVMELFPEQPLPFLLSGIANLQLKDYQRSIEVLNQGVRLVFENDDFFAEFYALLGDAYYQNQQNELSFKSYDKALIYNPNNATVLNNYSYYLSLTNNDLEKAKLMAEKAIKLEPNQSSYLDTYGWVLFKLGQYDKAAEYIYKAIQLNYNNPVLLEHYGDTQFKLGNIEEAQNYWKKAKDAGSDSKILEQKIKDKTYYE